jgi:hypothetical protein
MLKEKGDTFLQNVRNKKPRCATQKTRILNNDVETSYPKQSNSSVVSQFWPYCPQPTQTADISELPFKFT